MSFEEKLNSITKLVILLTIVGYIFTNKITLFVICLITLALIIALYYARKRKITTTALMEPFTANTSLGSSNLGQNEASTTNPITLAKVLRKNFHPTTKKNPFGNVLITDIKDEPDRAAAAPAFNPDVYDDIDKVVKKQTQMLNPTIKNTNKQLYGDLKANYDLDNSMMRFYSTANTRVGNDQGAYAQYLYGNMYSAKQSDAEGAMMRVKDNQRYILL